MPRRVITKPPSIKNGTATIVTIAILHEKKHARIIPAAKVVKVSENILIVSVVNPFKLEMSSERMFERIPGALSCLSNQATYLWSKLSKSSVRTL